MGYIYSPEWREEIEIHGEIKYASYRYMFVWGKTIKNASLKYIKRKNVPKVEFDLEIGSKQFLHCLCVGDNPTTTEASHLEIGDYIICVGKWISKPYYSIKKEEWREWVEFRCEHIIADQALTMQVGSEPTLQDDDPPDIFESIEQPSNPIMFKY